MYSSEADEPPVTTSAITSPSERGQAAAAACPGERAAAVIAVTARTGASTAKTPRGAPIRHLKRPLRRERGKLYCTPLICRLSGAYAAAPRLRLAVRRYHESRPVGMGPHRLPFRPHPHSTRNRRATLATPASPAHRLEETT